MNQSRADFFFSFGQQIFFYGLAVPFLRPNLWVEHPSVSEIRARHPLAPTGQGPPVWFAKRQSTFFCCLTFFLLHSRFFTSPWPARPGPAQPAPALPQWIEPKLRKCNNPALFVSKVLRWNLGPLSSPDNNTLGLKHGFLSTGILFCPYCPY